MEQKTFDQQSGKFIATIMQNLPPEISWEMQYFIENPKELKRSLKRSLILNTRLLKRDEEFIINACDGSETLVNFLRTTDFKGYEFTAVKNLYLADKMSIETPVQSYVPIKPGTIMQMFCSLGDNLDELCLTQHQIYIFIKKYHYELSEDYPTLFLFKIGENFFIAWVFASGAFGLRVSYSNFGNSYVIDGNLIHKLIIPKN